MKVENDISMHPFEYQLFMGFPLDPIFLKELAKVNIHKQSGFINEDYLQKIQYSGMEYLGKKIGPLVSFSDMELKEENIFSILKILVPDYFYDETPLMVFPIAN